MAKKTTTPIVPAALPCSTHGVFPDGHFSELTHPPAWDTSDVVDGLDQRIPRVHALVTLLSGWNEDSQFDYSREIGDILVEELRGLRMVSLRAAQLLTGEDADGQPVQQQDGAR